VRGRTLARHPAIVARALARCGYLLLPAVLIGLGLAILIQGGAFGIGAAE
jgi:cadmium resistance protein CadD (predicted permease)